MCKRERVHALERIRRPCVRGAGGGGVRGSAWGRGEEEMAPREGLGVRQGPSCQGWGGATAGRAATPFRFRFLEAAA